MLFILTSLFGGMNVTDSPLNIGLSKFFLAQLLIETAPRGLFFSLYGEIHVRQGGDL